MAVSLAKGQGLSLEKSKYDLSKVTIGLGWDIKQKTGFFANLMGKGDDYDLDVIAFLCDVNGKVRNLGHDAKGNATLNGSDVIYFNNLRHPSGHIWLTGDNRTGEGDGDDEQIIINLNQLPSNYQKVVFVVQIYQGKSKNQHFGLVQNAFIRAVDARGLEMLRFDLNMTQYANQRSMLFAELIRENNSWRFNAIGQPDTTDNFVDWLKRFVAY
nr:MULTISPECIES: TerD family protein [Moraxella]